MIAVPQRAGYRGTQGYDYWHSRSVGSALTPVETTVQVNFEARGGVERAAVVNHESLKRVERTAQPNIECRQAIERTAVVNHESMVGTSRTGVVNYECVQDEIMRVGIVNIESRKGIDRTAVVNHEARGGVEKTGVVNHESISTGNVPWRTQRRPSRYRASQQRPGAPDG